MRGSLISKIIAILLCIAMILSFAACGEESSSGGSSNSYANNEQSNNSETTDENKKDSEFTDVSQEDGSKSEEQSSDDKQGSILASLPEGAEGPYEVDRVVDGDTVIVYIDGERTRVRILCIDTPESVAPEETGKTNTSEGELASKRAKELLTDSYIYLEFDEEKYDQYDRMLAYVYLEDGRMFEEVMISEGMAKVVYYKPNVKYKDYLYQVQDQARKNKSGFWGTGFYK